MSSETQSIDFKNIPNGGFPNIYKLDYADSEPSKKKPRETVNLDPKIINIKDILMKKRHADPYLPIDLSK
jgi:hypothetical protein